MRRIFVCRSLLLGLALATASPLLTGCASPTKKPAMGAQKSWSDKLADNMKSGSTKMAAAVKPKTRSTPVDKPPTDRPSPELYVALANMAEKQGNFEQAANNYEKALAMDAGCLNALMGMAHLADRRDDMQGATKYYQKALAKHKNEASVYNDMGLCYHRRGMLAESSKALHKAVEIKPQRTLYRDNLASVLAEQGKTGEALEQLTMAHGVAVGNYNMGYLLTQKNDNAQALLHFRKAVEKDPTLQPAHEWIARLSGGAQHPGQLVATPPGAPQGQPGPASNVAYVQGSPPPTSYPAMVGVQAPPQQPIQQYSVASRPQTDSRTIRFPQVDRGTPSDAAMPPLPR